MLQYDGQASQGVPRLSSLLVAPQTLFLKDTYSSLLMNTVAQWQTEKQLLDWLSDSCQETVGGSKQIICMYITKNQLYFGAEMGACCVLLQPVIQPEDNSHSKRVVSWNSINEIYFKSYNHLLIQVRPQTLMKSISKICPCFEMY